MRAYRIIFIIASCFFFFDAAYAQQTKEKKIEIAMLKFLYNQKELTNPQDTVPSNLDVMYHRPILINKAPAKPGTIYVFGSYSPHGKRFIGLADQTAMNLLEAKDLPTDLQTILAFFKRNKINSLQGYKCLNVIADTYLYNEKRNFRPIPEEK
ncbi:hypothetical protein BDD43_3045 [Mucilaginibacter gracilis]|uniref:Uncharacterized protein n=1 Tax=Mucilaginibacter gracilis TaxID=423350 RepID=A0A495J3C2_9SPHI|nr:hypothetical protein [Mucilaginibacter gracilis]RKR82854.1 hypothetical protein BDD43_3045 [Mucilaginibacter gracilis]